MILYKAISHTAISKISSYNNYGTLQGEHDIIILEGVPQGDLFSRKEVTLCQFISCSPR
jgi:hypothetical protein